MSINLELEESEILRLQSALRYEIEGFRTFGSVVKGKEAKDYFQRCEEYNLKLIDKLEKAKQ